jgi:MFS family permease
VWVPGVRRLTSALAINVTLVAFESLSVATVLPVVSRHLGDLRLYGWVFSAFFLSSLLGIVAAGVLSDSRGIRLPIVGGLGVFAIGLAVAGTAPDMPVLVVGRLVQGFGAGCVPAAAYVVIGRAYQERDRPRMFAVLATAWVVPGVIGPAAAAQVAAHAGWRWVFLGLIPLTLIAALSTLPAIRSVPRPPSGPGVSSRPAIIGALAATVGAALLLVALSSAGPSLLDVLTSALLGALGAGVLLPALSRLTPSGTLRARAGLPAAVLIRGTLTFAYFAGDAYVPLTLTSIRHQSTTYGGLTLTAATLGWTMAAWIQARLVSRTGPRALIQVGLFLVLIGLTGLGSVLFPAVPVWLAPISWTVAGFGIGLAYSPISLTALGWATPGQEGKASSAVQLTDVLGVSLGTGAAGAAIAVAHHNSSHPRVGFIVAFGLAALVAVAAMVLSPRLPAQSSPSRPASQ